MLAFGAAGVIHQVEEAPAPRPRAAQIARRAGMAVAALLVVASPWWGRALLRHLDFFRVRRVEIDGARYVSPDEIVSRLRIDTAASLFDDVEPLEKRVRLHPSVRDVRIIERKLPGTLVVRITENLPVALCFRQRRGWWRWMRRDAPAPVDPAIG